MVCEKYYKLLGVSKTIEQVMKETKSNKLNDTINRQLMKYFETPFTKKNESLLKNDYYTYINNSWEKEIHFQNQSNNLKYYF